jgi:hypothetical protein
MLLGASDLMGQLRKQAAARTHLPAGRFFHPNERFWHHLCVLAGPGNKTVEGPTRFVDCGTGDGYNVMFAARSRGLNVEGIDIARRDGQHKDVVRGDACDIVWSPTMWPILCRPDHTGWANVVADNALRQGAKVIWCGKPENFKRDVLGSYRATVLVRNVGNAGENLYDLKPQRRHQSPL